MLLHAGPSSPDLEPTRLNAVVTQSVDLATGGASRGEARFVKVEVDLDPTLPDVRASPRNLARAVLNILGNALAAVVERARQEEAGYVPRVTVSTSRAADRAVLRVRDNGPGVPAEIREHIFSPFFTTRPAGEGTGLGLSIAYDIVVSQHRGRLSLDSEPGHAEFVIELPLA
jgi:signal transduction histidine kinase